MKRYFWLILMVFTVVVLSAGFFLLPKNDQAVDENQQTSTTADQGKVFDSSISPKLESIKAKSTIVYPISNYPARETKNVFGKYFPAAGTTNADRLVCPGAMYYVGYHTGIDLEATESELDQKVYAISIATGKVRQLGSVTGYGGLIVIDYTLDGSKYSAYYGHINISTVNLVKGDKVVAGDKIGQLGAACSAENGNVRKHLHFGLRSGEEVDVRGYVPSKKVLESWVDPKELLSSLEISE